MNNVEKHETEHTCNVCGGDVVNEYGTRRCDDFGCPTRDYEIDLWWDSPDEEIEEWRSNQITEVIKSMVGTIDSVDELKVNDILTIDHDDVSGDWRVSDIEGVDLGLTEIHVATVVSDDDSYALVGPCTHGEGKTVQIRETDADEVVDNIRPDDINVVRIS